MPLITNYKSDDSSLDDGDADCDDIFNSLTENTPNNALDEDDQPLVSLQHNHFPTDIFFICIVFCWTIINIFAIIAFNTH